MPFFPLMRPPGVLVLLGTLLWWWLGWAGGGSAIAAPIIVPITAPIAAPWSPTLLATPLAAPLAAPALDSPAPDAAPAAPQTPAQQFELHCAGCHVNGGNIIRRGKTLKARALARNGIDSPAAVATLIRQGKGLMSAYGDRFTPDQVDALATYVWQRSQENWR